MPRIVLTSEVGSELRGPMILAVLDGQPLRARAHKLRDWVRLSVHEPDDVSRLWAVPVAELVPPLTEIAVVLLSPIHEFVVEVTLTRSGYFDEVEGLKFSIHADLAHWARPWSYAEMLDTVRRVVAADGRSDLAVHDEDDIVGRSSFILAPLPADDQSIGEAVAFWAPAVRSLIERAVQELDASARRESLVTFFEFPAPVRAACQQYLVYFAQFLADLGIEADTELKEDAHRVLFGVTPRSGPEALDRVREALQAFLHMAEAPPTSLRVGEVVDVAVQQLQANVLHLQSQLTLAAAVLQAKDETINALKVSAFAYRQQLLLHGYLDPNTSSPSSDDVAHRAKEEKEQFLDGTVAVTKYAGKGFEIDLPKILRKLRRRFK